MPAAISGLSSTMIILMPTPALASITTFSRGV
jgi:hypothetical protein